MDVYFRSCPRDVRVTTSSFGIFCQCFSMSGVIPRPTGVRLVPQRDPRRGPRSLGLAPKENAFWSALQLSRARSRRNPRPQRRLPRAHPPRPIQSHPPGSGGLHPNRSRTPLQRPLPPKRHGPGWPSPAAGLPRSSLAPPFSLPRENLPYPALLFDGQLENPPSSRHQFRTLPHPRSGRPQETCPSPRPTPIIKELPFHQGR
jgi:hypothetical protein